MTRSMTAAGLALAALLLLTVAAAPAGSTDAGEPAVRCVPQVHDRLYFGLATPWGELRDEDFQRFVEREMLPRFPQGFTLLAAQGRWRDPVHGTLSEASRVFDLVHAAGDAAVDRHLREIAARYKRDFAQQAVLHVRSRVLACE